MSGTVLKSCHGANENQSTKISEVSNVYKFNKI